MRNVDLHWKAMRTACKLTSLVLLLHCTRTLFKQLYQSLHTNTISQQFLHYYAVTSKLSHVALAEQAIILTDDP